MRRNGNFIGKLLSHGLSSASGVFDTFDAYNYRRKSNWPLSFRYISLSPGSGTILENSSTNFTLSTAGFESNTILYWTILNGTSSSFDFVANVVSGSFTQNGSTNTGSFSIVTSLVGYTLKTTKTFQIQIRTGSISGPVVFTSGTFSIPALTASVSTNLSSVNEGGSFIVSTTIGNIGNWNTYFTSYSSSGTATSADFSGGLPSGFSFFNPGTYNTTFTTLADFTTEGNETINVTATLNGYTLGSTGTITINDTSQTPTASLSLSANPINEGVTMTVTVTTTNVSNGTTLYWTAENVSNWEASDLSATSGSFTVNSNSGSFTFNTVADGYTEGTEQFLLRVRVNSTSGTIIGSSTTISISDTSTGTPEPTFTQTLFDNLCAYLDDYMTEYRNPSFYSYSLNGDQYYIADGGGDMYDSGNFTYAWVLSNTVYAGNHFSSQAPSVTIGYSSNTSSVTIDTSFVYRSLGYSTGQLPLTVLAYRTASNTPIGFQKGGNIGADGGGTYASGLVYDNATVNTFTVYAFRRITYNAGDPSVCDLYMLIGHSNWGSSFGARSSSGDTSTDSGGSYFYAASSTNVIAVAMLLSKSSGVEVTAAECQTVIQNFTSRMKIHLGY